MPCTRRPTTGLIRSSIRPTPLGSTVSDGSATGRIRTGATSHGQLVAAMLSPPIRNDQFEAGFGTLYTAEYQPAAGTATWHWPETSWTRGFDDPDDVREVRLA